MSQFSKTFYILLAAKNLALTALSILFAVVLSPWFWLLAVIYLLLTIYPVVIIYEDHRK